MQFWGPSKGHKMPNKKKDDLGKAFLFAIGVVTILVVFNYLLTRSDVSEETKEAVISAEEKVIEKVLKK